MALFKNIKSLILSIILLFFASISSHAAVATFSWTEDQPVSGYKIHYGTSSGNYNLAVDVGLPAAVNGIIVATIQGLQEGNTYYFCASAYTATGESNCSNEVTYKEPVTTDTAAPSIPAGLSASAASTSQINLSWTASKDNIGVTGYKIYRGGTYVASSLGASYADRNLNSGTSYSYKVSAVDAAGNESGQSSLASATTATTQVTTPTTTYTGRYSSRHYHHR